MEEGSSSIASIKENAFPISCALARVKKKNNRAREGGREKFLSGRRKGKSWKTGYLFREPRKRGRARDCWGDGEFERLGEEKKAERRGKSMGEDVLATSSTWI